MRMRWHRLLFAHWAVEPGVLRALIPEPLELETYEGRAYVGVVPFAMSDVRPRCSPRLGGLSAFPEINVRTYVRAGDKPGVYFFSLDIPRRLPVHAARGVYRLAYYLAAMREAVGDAGRVHYESRRVGRTDARLLRHLPHPVDGSTPAAFRGTYRAVGPPAYAEAGSFEHFATERYCLYTVTRRGRVLRGEIHHGPWPLQPAEASFEVQTMTAPLGLELTGEPVLHYAHELDVVAWGPAVVR